MLWGVGALAGLLLAVGSALTPTHREATTLEPETLARVNGRAIPTGSLALAEGRVRADGADALTAEERADLVDFLIEEELLVQRAEAMGLVESDRTVRSALVMAVIDGVVEDVLSRDPTEAELRAYYDSHTAVFTTPPRLHVRHMHFPNGETPALALTQATEARQAVAGGLSFAEARSQFGAGGELLPDGPVPIHVLRRYLGGALTELIADLPPGTVSGAIETASGYHIVFIVAAEPARLPAFESIRDVVRRECIRRGRDTALDDLLQTLRSKADIALAPDAPPAADTATGTSR